MPVVPNSLSVEPLYSGNTNITANRAQDRHNLTFNYRQNSPFVNDFVANVSEEQLEEITHTLHVNMVSESLNNINEMSSNSLSSNAVNNRDSSNNSLNYNNLVCGVIVVDERITLRNSQHNEFAEPFYKNYIVLGSVVLGRCNYSGEELRRCLQSQLSSVLESSQKFTFLTKEGWPVLRSQENKINASNIISSNNVIAIRKAFDKPRLGITNTNGECFGFIFFEYFWTLRQLRDTIDEHLKEFGAKNQKLEYMFIEKNGWPVATNQELLLSVLDIIVNHNICIQSGSLSISSISNTSNSNVNAIQEAQQLFALPSIKYGSNDEAINSNVQKTQDITDSIVPGKDWNKKSTKRGAFSVSIKQTTRRENKKVVRIKSGKSSAKPIMLSYARQEAAQHALDLKKQLVHLGYSVYLDVHEIQTGSDWQDSLNDAVRSCEIFVPLVTPMYGKTQWTNREVKLADLLRKYIIPINFLDTWPPECLAIQFATTQYIPWRPTENEHETPIEKSIPDIKVWPQVYLDRVSSLIAEHVMQKMVTLPKPEMPSLKALNEIDGPKDNEPEKPLIVISAHPQQKTIVAQIKSLLSEEYNVWCSTDLPEGGLVEEDVIGNTSPPFTPSQLPTIAEEKETIFSDAYKDIARKIVENSKQRPKSLPPGSENHTIELKKPLTRMLSQTSETSHLSSLTPEAIDRLKALQEQVICASVVIVVASEIYYKSRTSQQHVYYCEHRKKMILVRCDLSPTPAWFSMLIAQDFLLSVKNPRFNELLKSRVKRTLDPLTKAPTDDMHESKMQYLVSFMKKNLPLLETCVYVVGSTKLQDPRSEEICKAIGSELAKVKNVIVVTSGFYGAGDIVASSFYEVRQSNQVSNNIPVNTIENKPNSFESSVVHIVPLKDSEDFSSKCRQNSDGSFESVPYGKTMFLGESVKEREGAVARILDTCILIEGGPGAAHEIEEFIWNDHFIIPVISSGGAASGKYGVPVKIFDCPHGVAEEDWALLSSPDASPLEVAKAIVRIVVGLKKAIAQHALSRLNVQIKAKNRLMGSRSTKKKLAERRKVNISAANAINSIHEDGEPNSPEKMLPVIESVIDTSTEKTKSSKWKRMHRLITFSKNC